MFRVIVCHENQGLMDIPFAQGRGAYMMRTRHEIGCREREDISAVDL